MAILKIQINKDYFSFSSSPFWGRRGILMIVFLVFTHSFAQITVIGDTKIFGTENLHYISSTNNIYVVEGTSIYNFPDESAETKIVYLKIPNKEEKLDVEKQGKVERLASVKQNKSSEIKKKEIPVNNVTKYKNNTSKEAFTALLHSNRIATVSSGNYKADALIDDYVLTTTVYIWKDSNKIDSEIQTYSNYAQTASKIRPPPKLV